METMSQLNQIYMSKKAIHIVVSLVTVLSFVLVSYSTLFLPFLSTFSINFFTYSNDRNYIFLLCNGILVFLIKNSALVTDHIEYSQVQKTTEEEEEEITQNEFLVSVSDKENSHKNDEAKQEHFLDIQENDNNYCNDEKDEEKQELLLDIQEDVNSYCNNINDDDDDDEEEEEEEDEVREELNKRCEEFIRRMKHDIQTQAT